MDVSSKANLFMAVSSFISVCSYLIWMKRNMYKAPAFFDWKQFFCYEGPTCLLVGILGPALISGSLLQLYGYDTDQPIFIFTCMALSLSHFPGLWTNIINNATHGTKVPRVIARSAVAFYLFICLTQISLAILVGVTRKTRVLYMFSVNVVAMLQYTSIVVWRVVFKHKNNNSVLSINLDLFGNGITWLAAVISTTIVMFFNWKIVWKEDKPDLTAARIYLYVLCVAVLRFPVQRYIELHAEPLLKKFGIKSTDIGLQSVCSKETVTDSQTFVGPKQFS